MPEHEPHTDKDKHHENGLRVSAGRYSLSANGQTTVTVVFGLVILAALAWGNYLNDLAHRRVVNEQQILTCVTSIPTDHRSQFRLSMSQANSRESLRFVVRSWCPWLDIVQGKDS